MKKVPDTFFMTTIPSEQNAMIYKQEPSIKLIATPDMIMTRKPTCRIWVRGITQAILEGSYLKTL